MGMCQNTNMHIDVHISLNHHLYVWIPPSSPKKGQKHLIDAKMIDCYISQYCVVRRLKCCLVVQRVHRLEIKIQIQDRKNVQGTFYYDMNQNGHNLFKMMS